MCVCPRAVCLLRCGGGYEVATEFPWKKKAPQSPRPTPSRGFLSLLGIEKGGRSHCATRHNAQTHTRTHARAYKRVKDGCRRRFFAVVCQNGPSSSARRRCPRAMPSASNRRCGGRRRHVQRDRAAAWYYRKKEIKNKSRMLLLNTVLIRSAHDNLIYNAVRLRNRTSLSRGGFAPIVVCRLPLPSAI